MSMMKLEKMTPSVYCEESRDFQLFCRLYNIVFNGVKYDIDSMINLLDVYKCKESMLDYMATRVGYYPRLKSIDERAMRIIIDSFPYLLRNKGSKKGIETAIFIWLQIINSNRDYRIDLFTDNLIKVKIEGKPRSLKLLQEIMRYVIPTGWGVQYNFYEKEEEQMYRQVVTSYVKTQEYYPLNANGDEDKNANTNGNLPGTLNSKLMNDSTQPKIGNQQTVGNATINHNFESQKIKSQEGESSGN